MTVVVMAMLVKRKKNWREELVKKKKLFRFKWWVMLGLPLLLELELFP